MSVRKNIPYHGGIFFITFTCWKWLNLFQITDGYDTIYKWFDILKAQGHQITGYVTMPNHFHGLLAFRNNPGASINTIIGNGKRFIAYDLIKRLTQMNACDVLTSLTKAVSKRNHNRGVRHTAFEPSFDWKECHTEKFLVQKLNYIHNNPCRNRWRLAANPWEYVHSSALFYKMGVQGRYEVMDYRDWVRGVPETGDSAGTGV